MRLGIRYTELGELTIPAIQAVLDEARARRHRVMGRARQQKAMGVIDVGQFW